MNQQFLNIEILNRIANGNTLTLNDDMDIQIRKEIAYCEGCGFPMESNYEKEIGFHIECKSK